MNNSLIKATLWVAFIVLTITLTYLGLNKSEATIDFNALNKEKNQVASESIKAEFENLIKNIGSSTTVVKPDVLTSTDTSRIALSIQLLDTMKQYLYAAVLSEKIAKMQNNPIKFHDAARYYLMELYDHEAEKNELMLTKKAKENLEKSLELQPENIDAKIDLAVSVYNINRMQTPENQSDLMRPALLLREVIAKDSNNLDALYYLGKLSVESNQFEKAIERFKKLVSLQPQNPDFYFEISQIYAQMGEKEESELWNKKGQSLTKTIK